MKKIPVSFEYQGKTISGELSAVMGAGTSVYHLMIDKYYCGRLRRALGEWVFDPTPKTRGLVTLVEYFGESVSEEK